MKIESYMMNTLKITFDYQSYIKFYFHEYDTNNGNRCTISIIINPTSSRCDIPLNRHQKVKSWYDFIFWNRLPSRCDTGSTTLGLDVALHT